jgi:hypothetical protein
MTTDTDIMFRYRICVDGRQHPSFPVFGDLELARATAWRIYRSDRARSVSIETLRTENNS